MKIRKIIFSDLKIISEILEKAYSKKPYFEKFEEDFAFKYVKSRFEKNKNTSFLIGKDWKVIWFCFSSLSYWTNWLQAIIEEIVIDSDFQGEWYGKEIYFFVENFLKNLWVKSIILWVQNDSDAFYFHQKNWFLNSKEHSIMFKNF